jgi:hypothetical protein
MNNKEIVNKNTKGCEIILENEMLIKIKEIVFFASK